MPWRLSGTVEDPQTLWAEPDDAGCCIDAEAQRINVLQRMVIFHAIQLVDHRRAAVLQHFDGHDDVGNEKDNTEWMLLALLERAVDDLRNAAEKDRREKVL